MNCVRTVLCWNLILLIAGSGTAAAESTVTVRRMHLCCDHCVRDATAAIQRVKGARLSVNRKENSITIMGADDTTVQKALHSIAAAGFHGTTGKSKLKIKDDSGVKPGKVRRLELVGIHNCCGGCNRAVKKAIASVEGVVSDTATPKQTSLTVVGDFDGKAVVQALFKAGFHVKARRKTKTGRAKGDTQ